MLGWLYVTTDNSRSNALLFKSVMLFVLPTLVIVVLPEGLFQFPQALLVVAFIEELLKASAARTERNHMDRFLLVALFGIWELTWVKPLWALSHPGVLENWSNLQLAGLTAAGLVTVLMHTVTAELYAFCFKGHLPTALFASWCLHVIFNGSVGFLGVSFLASLLEFMPLFLLFVALWPAELRKGSTSR